MAFDEGMPTVIRTVRVLVHGQLALGEPAWRVRRRVVRSAALALRRLGPTEDLFLRPVARDDADPFDLVGSFARLLRWSFARDGVSGGGLRAGGWPLSMVRRAVDAALAEPTMFDRQSSGRETAGHRARLTE
jgi:hypothetical protein